MKVLLVLVALATVALVMSEDCPTNNISDCGHVTCSNGFHKACVNRICTCTVSDDHKCMTQADCAGHGNCDRTWHCVDNLCRCFGGGGGGGK